MANPSDRPDQASAVKRALVELREMRAKLDALEAGRREPIAVVGLAIRAPGSVSTPEAYWQLLRDGRDAITDIPASRWDVDAYYDPNPDVPGKMYARRGGFVDDVDRFDPHFFGISPREALSLDPQQRLLLEVSWEALEHAGTAPADAGGSPTGVFVGLTNSDYYRQLFTNVPDIDAYFASGTSASAAAGRLSYTLGFRGPSLAVDTACSSSLVAVHLACRSLRANECERALAGGVNLILSPELNVACSKARMLAPDGACKTFDASADGYVRSEGCGMLVLKRLSQAQRDGDRILAVIRGSAVNQDGRSSGLTVPYGPSQEAVIRAALADAAVDPREVDLVEAHGTGTSLGDPIELNALASVYCEARSADAPLVVSSVKTNIGHLESAAGVAGLIKLILALTHDEIPPHLHFHSGNPHFDWASVPIVVPTSARPWPERDGRRRIAAVSSFGFSGTNAHLVVEAAPAADAPDASADRPLRVVALSARSDAALRELADRYDERFERDPDVRIADVAFTANTGRVHFAHRLALVAGSTDDARAALAAFRSGDEHPAVRAGESASHRRPHIAFLFTGQGAQYPGMGRELFESEPVFRDTLRRCDELLRAHLDRSLLSVLFPAAGDEHSIHDTAYTQPALFAVELALSELWRSWGIEPDAVMGHSLGEIAAACAAGIVTLEDGLALIAARGRLMQALPDDGDMVTVFDVEARVREAIGPHAGAVAIAAINGPDAVAISGRRAEVRAIAERFERAGVRVKPMVASRAFHSPLMDPMLDAFRDVSSRLTFSAPQVPIVSNVTGAVAASGEMQSADYWGRHARGAVRFAAGVDALQALGCDTFVEIGPGSTLLGMGRRCVPDAAGTWLPSIRSERGERQEILSSLATLYVRGAEIDWQGVERTGSRRRTALPTYPFQRERYWTNRAAGAPFAAEPSGVAHPLLGRRVPTALKEALFEQVISLASLPFLTDHQVHGTVLFPATGYVEIAAAAGSQVLEGTTIVENLSIADPLPLPRAGEVVVQTIVAPSESGSAVVQIFSGARTNGRVEAWRLHATATVSIVDSASAALPRLSDVRAACTTVVEVEAEYAALRATGIDYGDAFRGLASLSIGERSAVGDVRLPEAAGDAAPFGCHPALLDACLHVLGPMLATRAGRGSTYLPVTIDRVRMLGAPGARVWSTATLRASGSSDETLVADLAIFDEAGAPVASIEGLHLKRATAEALRRATRSRVADWLVDIAWQPAAGHAGESHVASGTWLVLGDASATSAQLVARLSQSGARTVVVEAAGGYEMLSAGHVRVDPLSAADFDRLSREAIGDEPLAGLVFLWSASTAAPDASLDDIESRVRLGCGGLLSLVQMAGRRKDATRPRLWVVTRGAQPAGGRIADAAGSAVWGFARAVASEYPDLACTAVDLDLQSGGDVDAVWREIASPDGENQVAVRGGSRLAARLVKSAPPATVREQPVQLVTTSRGILDNLQLQPIERRAPAAGEVEIRVAAAGLNFRDVLNALGMYPGDPGALGNECAGTISAIGEGVADLAVGDEVVAIGSGTFSTFTVTRATKAVRKARTITLDEAATVPITFLTAAWALDRLAGMRRGDRVLIHAAAGGVGLAAVQLAQRAGAEIFATAGSPEKRAYLTSLGVRHVMDSRSVAFADDIAAVTDGRGVDIVLNSLNGDAIPASLRALRPGGAFLEIGKNGIWSAEEMTAARPDVAYSIIFLGDVDDAITRPMLAELMTAFDAGTLRPLPLKTFSLTDAAAGFRYMAQAKHIGKVVITQAASSQPSAVQIRSDGTYLVTGGAGGLGLVVAQWLLARGAQSIVLMGRRAPADGALASLAAAAPDARVAFEQGDVSREDDVRRVVDVIAASTRPLRGVFHLAGVLDDGVIAQQAWERFARVMAPKIAGAWHLHRLAGSLDCFVLFSSMASVLGTAGQSPYAAANAFLDGLAHLRRAQGQPALSVNWGPWGGAGMATTVSAQDARRWSAQGIGIIDADQGIAALEQLLRRPAVAQAGVLPADWTKVLAQYAPGTEPPLLRGVAPERNRAVARAASTPATRATLIDQLRDVPASSRPALLVAHVRDQAIRVLGLDPAFKLDTRVGLRDLGLDSLMALELRNRLQRSVGQTLPSTLAFDCPTVDALAAYLESKLAPAPEAKPAAAAAPDPSPRATGPEPIAIVGMACRFPGRASTPEAFWQLLHDGVDAITEVPSDRWNIDAFYDSDAAAPGKMQTRWGGFVDGVDRFDPQFFGIAPREAAFMDPQQRLLLEVSWQALERAGHAPDALAGSKTGVFVGISTNDYLQLQVRTGDTTCLTAYSGTGSSLSVAAGRLSYTLGLQGPALSVDTACSSSLVAVHLACQSLRAGECQVALAGGVNLILLPEVSVVLSKGNMMSPTGRCRTFAADADGYVRGEGCGVVVLKRLSDAIASGDNVLAVIRGTGVNQDGRSSGLTVPSGPAQESLIRETLAASGVRPADVDYVEAHGTGTALGDPIEVNALSAVLGHERPADRPVLIGSVKTNIGHLESAAGVAALIKTVLALQHREIPASLHFTTPNPHIAWNELPVSVAASTTEWSSREGRPRTAAVSSFGFSGTNAHLVVEEAPGPAPVAPTAIVERPAHVLTLSARTDTAVGILAGSLADYVDAEPTATVADVAFSANTGRAQLDARLAVVAASRDELVGHLRDAAAGRPLDGGVRQTIAASERPAIAFLFSGQGSQYAGMGRRLFETQPAFRRALERCDEILRPLLDRSLLSVMYPAAGEATPLDDTAYTQPALFALEYALAELWRSWGVEPSAVMGHSVGEFAAACVAGVFSLEDGLTLIAARGRAMQALPGGGAMAAVFAGESRVAEAIARRGAAVSIAAFNGDENTVVSGSKADVDAVVADLASQGIDSERLNVSHAFHSALMDPALEAFGAVARRITYSAPRIALVSNVTGRTIGADTIADAGYWLRHLREPVRCADGLRALRELGCGTFLEIGPAPVLVGMGRRMFDDPDLAWLPSLRRTQDDWTQLLGAVAALWARGARVDFAAFDRGYARRKLLLPTTPFERQRYWLDLEPPQSTRGSVARDGAAAAEQPAVDAAAPADWTYALKWTRYTGEQAVVPPADGSSLVVFADRTGVGDALAARWRARGAECAVVYAGERLENVGPQAWTFDGRDDFTAPLRTVLATIGAPVRHVVFLWGLDAPASDAPTAAALEEAQRHGTASALRVMQALLRDESGAMLRIVTRFAQTVGGTDGRCAVAQAPLWGLGRAIALEHPEIWGGLVDLDVADADAAAAQLLAELDRGDDEDQVAVRGGARYLARLEPRVATAAPAKPLDPDAAYLVTGGLGVLGLAIARWLVRNGARRIALAGRSGLPDRSTWVSLDASTESGRRVAGVRGLEALGATVDVLALDVCDEHQVDEAIDRFGRSLPPLRGVVHAASATGAARLRDMTTDALLAMLRPKVTGTWALHSATQRVPLDFFVLFSSAAALLGSNELGHYAAANSFLDAAAHYRRAAGLPAVSVNWGAWAEMRDYDERADGFVRAGMRLMPTADALEAFGRLRSSDVPQLMVASIDWATFKPVYEAKRRRPLIADVRPAAPASAVTPGRALMEELAAIEPDDRRARLVDRVRAEAAAVLGLPAAEIDPRKGLFDLGMDSLMSVDLKRRLERLVGFDLPTTVTFKYPSVSALADFLIERLGVASTPAGRPAPSEQPGSDASRENLSEDDLAALLLERLGQMR